jgi:cyanophycin synthetase
MKIVEMQVLRGPNCWSISVHRLIVMHIDVGKRGTGSIPDLPKLANNLKDRLSVIFNENFDHDFEKEQSGVSDMPSLIGFVLAFTALQIQRQLGMSCRYKAVKTMTAFNATQVVFEYAEENTGILTAKTAKKIIESLFKDSKYNALKGIQAIQDKWNKIKPGQLTGCILDEAIKRNIPYFFLTSRPLIQLGYGASHRRIQSSVTDQTSSFGVKIASNKEQSKKLLWSLGIPVPMGKLIFGRNELSSALDKTGFPVVLKPQSGNQGKGVSVNVNNFEDAANAFEAAQKISHSDGVIVEKYITGFDYRILVINYKFVAAAKRIPAMITGNGRSTIEQLIDIANSDPRRGEGHGKPLTIIKIDDATHNILKSNDLGLDSILPVNKILFLKSIANLSMGGTSMDATELVHPDNIFLAERIAKIVGLDICGMDVISRDIGVPFNLNGGAVVEVNSAPGFRLHMDPTEGKPRNAAGCVIDMLFPSGSSPYIPIVAMTSNKNSATLCDLIACMMTRVGKKVGYASSKGMYVQNVMIFHGNCTSYEHAELILKDPMVDFAVFECALSGIRGSGVAFHHCNVGIVIDMDELMAASVIPACVLPTGYAILNADDEEVYQIHKDLECNIAYLSANPQNPYVINHIRNGGYAAFFENGQIVACQGPDKRTTFNMNNIPQLLIKRDTFTIQNILAFVLTALIYNVFADAIQNELEIYFAISADEAGNKS